VTSRPYAPGANRSTNRSGRSGRRAFTAGLALVAVCVVTLGIAANAGDDQQVVSAAGPDPAASPAAVALPSTSPPNTSPPRTSPPRTLDHRPRVAFFGDSLGSETDPHLAWLLAERGVDYRFGGHPGTATCDYLDEMRRRAQDYHPDVVVLLFTGNALTPCITARSGGDRGIVGPDGPAFMLSAFESAYLEDTVAAIETFDNTVDVVLVGLPPTRTERSAAAYLVDNLYRLIAESYPNVYYLSPERLLTANGDYVDELPCMAVEPCTPGEPVPVRADDGGHLCAPAPTFCFGGLRMGVMIADQVTQLVATSAPEPRT
jgi:hypothetical protein